MISKCPPADNDANHAPLRKSATDNKKADKESFVYIPHHVLRNDRLSLSQKLVAGLIIGLSNKEGFCWASNQYMSDILGISESAVCKAVKMLVFLQVIERVTEVFNGATKKRILFLASVKFTSSERKKYARTRVKNTLVASVKSTQYNEDHIKDDIEVDKAAPILDIPQPPPPPPPKALFHPFSKDRVLLTEENIQKLLIDHYHSDEVALRDDIDSADAHCQQKGFWLQGEAAIGFLRKWKKNAMEYRGGRPRQQSKAERIKAKDDANFAEIKKQFGIT